jgi:formylglycine-generating enzyme required for sulfatase activity
MAFIPGGTFQMGSSDGEPNESPVHTVTVSDFWLDTTEVTQKEFYDLMAITYSGYLFPNWYDNGNGDNYPAYNVSWFEAILYCNAKTKASGSIDTVYRYTYRWNTAALDGLSTDMTKRGYRLPTEAEWEYACRGETTTAYYWGSNSIDSYSWYDSNSGPSIHPVAQKQPNTFDLYDMSGNLWEWCNDWNENYSTVEQVDPTGPASGYDRVLRGGCWYYSAWFLRSSQRLLGSPGGRDIYRGFRVALPVR